MPVPVPLEYRYQSRKKSGFGVLYLASLLLSFHWAIVLYINSSYVEQFVSSKTVSVLYIVGALLTIVAFLYASPVLSKFGNVRTAVFLTLLEGAVLLGMAVAGSAYTAVICFLLHLSIVPLILFNIDVFLEDLIGEKEGTTGARRGLLFTIISFTGAIAALGMGKLVGDGAPNFELVYIASAAMLIPFLYILLTSFRTFKDPAYPELYIFAGLTGFWKQRDIRNVFFAHFLLQFFFAWMVIYTPIYLYTVIGFNWEQIGMVLFAGLMGYVFLEYPIGVVADTYIGEKEMMAFGFVIIALATSWFIFLEESSLFMWMFAMFMTRVGASFVETTTESYFFKHTESKDTNIIGIFRITRPLSYILGAALGSLALYLFHFEFLFLLLGLLMIPGLFFAMCLRDTR